MPALPLVRRTAASVLLATALTAGGALAAGPAHAAPVTSPLAPADTLRASLAAVVQGHAQLQALMASATLTQPAAFAASAATQLSLGELRLVRGVGATGTVGSNLLATTKAHDAALLAYAVSYDRYRGSARDRRVTPSLVSATRAADATALHAAVPAAPSSSLGSLLRVGDETTEAALRALGARSPLVYGRTQNAVLGTQALARLLANGLDASRGLAGSAVSPAADTRARAVALNLDHPFQVGLASAAGLTYGLRSAAWNGAYAALDANTVALTRFYGTRVESAYLAQWRRHTNDYRTDVAGWIVGNAGLRTAAAIDLAGYAAATAPLLEVIAPGVTTARYRAQLVQHTAGTLGLIAKQATKDPSQYTAAAMGGNMFAAVGDEIGVGIARRQGLSG